MTLEPGYCKHGTNVGFSDQGITATWNCAICEEELENLHKKQHLDEQRARKRQLHVASYNSDMKRPYQDFTEIPYRFKGKNLIDYEANTKDQKLIKSVCEKYVENIDEVRKKGTSMVFCGSPGTGKTHLAYAMAQYLQQRLVTAAVVTAANMTSYVKQAYKIPWYNGMGSGDSTPQDVQTEFSHFELLIIDEAGIQTDSEAEKRIFFDIINKRYENMDPTIIMSNLTLDELTAFIGERVMDRMKEGGGMVFAFDWGSYRK